MGQGRDKGMGKGPGDGDMARVWIRAWDESMGQDTTHLHMGEGNWTRKWGKGMGLWDKGMGQGYGTRQGQGYVTRAWAKGM